MLYETSHGLVRNADSLDPVCDLSLKPELGNLHHHVPGGKGLPLHCRPRITVIKTALTRRSADRSGGGHAHSIVRSGPSCRTVTGNAVDFHKGKSHIHGLSIGGDACRTLGGLTIQGGFQCVSPCLVYREGVAPGRATGGHGGASLSTSTGSPSGVGHFDVGGEEGQGGGLALPGSGDSHVRFSAQGAIHSLDLPRPSLAHLEGVCTRSAGGGQRFSITRTGQGGPSGVCDSDSGAEESQRHALALSILRDAHGSLGDLSIQLGLDCPCTRSVYGEGIAPRGVLGFIDPPVAGAS